MTKQWINSIVQLLSFYHFSFFIWCLYDIKNYCMHYIFVTKKKKIHTFFPCVCLFVFFPKTGFQQIVSNLPVLVIFFIQMIMSRLLSTNQSYSMGSTKCICYCTRQWHVEKNLRIHLKVLQNHVKDNCILASLL